MQNITTNVSRRTFLAGAGSAAVVAVLGLAGCGATGGSTAGSAGSASESGEDLLAQIQDRGEMIFATEGTWSPWTFHDADGNLTGYDIEVARAIAAELGVEASFAEGEWDGLLAGLDSGRYDTMANGVSVTEQREEQYDFTEPYAYNRIVVITLNDSDITSLDDLEASARPTPSARATPRSPRATAPPTPAWTTLTRRSSFCSRAASTPPSTTRSSFTTTCARTPTRRSRSRPRTTSPRTWRSHCARAARPRRSARP